MLNFIRYHWYKYQIASSLESLDRLEYNYTEEKILVEKYIKKYYKKIDAIQEKESMAKFKKTYSSSIDKEASSGILSIKVIIVGIVLTFLFLGFIFIEV